MQLCALCEKKRALALNSGAWLSGFKGPLPKRAVRAVAPVVPHLPKLLPAPKRSESGSGTILLRDAAVSDPSRPARTSEVHAPASRTLSGGRKLSAPGSLSQQQPRAELQSQPLPTSASDSPADTADAEQQPFSSSPAAVDVPVAVAAPEASRTPTEAQEVPCAEQIGSRTAPENPVRILPNAYDCMERASKFRSGPVRTGPGHASGRLHGPRTTER